MRLDYAVEASERGRHSPRKEHFMDRITESLLEEFCRDFGLTTLKAGKQFEHFAAYITINRHYTKTFSTDDVVVGEGGDTAIDTVAIIINESLITDIEAFDEIDSQCDTLEVNFIFVQADRGASFDGAKMSDFGYGVKDFFNPEPTLRRNQGIIDAAAIMDAVYKKSGKFRRGNPICRLYYVTTGRWVGDHDLEGRIKTAIDDLKGRGLFRDVTYLPIDADGVQKLYNQTKNAIQKDFLFVGRAVVPSVAGVTEAHLGVLPAQEFLKILRDDDGQIIKSIFYDNVRDWLEYDVAVNNEIKATLASNFRDRFVLMNNGVTIIARELRTVGNRFYIEDFQIVNGCQTSHVLFDNENLIDESVAIPVRLISTQDEDVINSIIRATNRQTQVTDEQFLAFTDFSKKLETFFQAFPPARSLFYERRMRQFAGTVSIDKTRVISPGNVIRSFAAMFLGEPHRTTRNYAALRAKVGTEIFGEQHRPEPYYVSAFAFYRLESFFRSGLLDSKFKVTRYHILLAMRLLGNPQPLPQFFNSHDMERYCAVLQDILWDDDKTYDLVRRSVAVIDRAARGDFNRDNIRVEAFTNAVKAEAASA